MSGGLRLVGIEELSAGALRDRLLARADAFWSDSALPPGDVRALHDPLFFHQLGGFGAVALTPDDRDAGYLLGLVTADRLAVVQALAVDPAHRRHGVAVRLLERFAALAAGTGARVVQAVAVPGDGAVLGLARRFGARVTPSAGHAGPGADRLVLTRALPLHRR
ncbi:GNAT family N-acetyltransferase [Geodermatophilus sp. YIM 151500]|uniref:GNAT family N-acetyltransferase n=1 Tax=Geodermatophilus sp. YIM 151500 TaxID=2984531 RepID=UPI0021E49952|nr:GNAT family N-acetyltransferase [Geodermatophilus sp. YIM 151500]MCV2488429.1 GNAT family N-acetyltransferase [Geodermatophilus sp. YIM 151500]